MVSNFGCVRITNNNTDLLLFTCTATDWEAKLTYWWNPQIPKLGPTPSFMCFCWKDSRVGSRCSRRFFDHAQTWWARNESENEYYRWVVNDVAPRCLHEPHLDLTHCCGNVRQRNIPVQHVGDPEKCFRKDIDCNGHRIISRKDANVKSLNKSGLFTAKVTCGAINVKKWGSSLLLASQWSLHLQQ